MEYTTLGHSGIKIPRFCLGGMSFGEASPDFHQWTIGPDDTKEIIKYAFDKGLNFIDTANVYAFGTSEEYIGRAIKELGIKREDVVLASKVYFNEGNLSKEAILREIDGTLSRLGTEYLDLYIIHRFDYNTPIEETMEALNSLVKAGKVRALGASSMYAYQFHNMQICAEQNGWTKFTSMQDHYNLIYREEEREMIPVCRQFNVALTPYSPLASGHLCRTEWDSDSKRSETDTTSRNKFDSEKEHSLPVIERVSKVADDHGATMTQVALAWMLKKGVESPIVGFSSTARVDDAIGALDVKLTEDEVDYLEELYVARPLCGPLARPGEKALAGSTKVKLKR